jgi:hypothetical protein
VALGRERDLDALRVARTVTLGLDITTGQPPLIVQAAAYRVAGGLITGGPFSYYAAVDAPYHQIPQRCWPSLYHAPLWPKTAGRLVELIADRVLVMHDRDRFNLLRRHRPDWQPAVVGRRCRSPPGAVAPTRSAACPPGQPLGLPERAD